MRTGLLLLVLACGTETDFVDALPEAYCESLFRCYDRLEADCTSLSCLWPDEQACLTELREAYPTGHRACPDGQRFRADEADACLSAFDELPCEALVSGEWPAPCQGVCEP
jgi:hypothetical protein